MHSKHRPVDQSTKDAQQKRITWMLVGSGISLVLAVYLLKHVNFSQFTEIVREVPVPRLLMAFGLYLFLGFCRALRFRTFLGHQHLPLKILFPIALYHNFLARTLPFMTGEISYVAMVRRYLNQPVSKGVGSLLSARLFELLLILSGGIVAVFSTQDRLTYHGSHLTFVLMTSLGACLAGTYFSGTICTWIRWMWRWLIRYSLGERSKIGTLIDQKLHELTLQLTRIRQPRLLFQALFFSLWTYGTSVSFHLILLRGIGIEQSLGALLAVISLSMLVSFFPLSLSGFGIIEGGWTLGLVVFANLEVGEATSIGFFLHGCQLVSAALSGLLGYTLLHLTKDSI